MIVTGALLPISTPAAQGIRARGIHGFLDAVEAAPGIDPHGLVMMRHGYVVAAGWWFPYSAERPQLLYSLSKSFTATALGFAVAEGLLGLDDPVIAHFPEFDREVTDPRIRSMRVRHLATMATGHLADTWEQAVAADPAEPVRGFLSLPPEREPGSVFAYNQSATYTMAAIVQRASGQPLSRYLRPRLFDPLGVPAVGWREYPPGRELGFSGLYASTDAVARLGQLYLQRGIWQGKRLLAEAWVAAATRLHVTTEAEPNPDWQQGYGFQFWMSRHGYRGDGAFGQFCLVLPEQDAVIALTTASLDMQSLLDAVWEHLLPALGDTPISPGQPDADLADRLPRLALAAVRAEPAPPVRRDEWADTSFAPAGGDCEQQPSLIGVVVAEDRDGWHITLRETGSELRLRLGRDGWVVSDPVASAEGVVVPTAVSGGWTDATTLRVEVIFLETPHRLIVTCALPSRTFEAMWTTMALQPGHLAELRSPRRPRDGLSG